MPNGCQPEKERLSVLVIFRSTPSQKGIERVQEDVEFVDIGGRAKARRYCKTTRRLPVESHFHQRFSHLTVTRCYVRPATAGYNHLLLCSES